MSWEDMVELVWIIFVALMVLVGIGSCMDCNSRGGTMVKTFGSYKCLGPDMKEIKR